MTWLKLNWERCFLFVIAIIFLIFSFGFFVNMHVAGATAAFVMFFLCLIYSNVSRFKRFKGLGFEAELWEDKQKEAAELIDRLKDIVQVYTREIVMAKVMSGRFGGTTEWPDRWALFEELIDQHDTLGQHIDFLPLKEKVYRVMVFDAVSHLYSKLETAFAKARSDAQGTISEEFGHPVIDVAGQNERQRELRDLDFRLQDLFKISESDNVARFVLERAEKTAQGFQEKFGIEVQFPDDELKKLRQIDALFQVGDLRIDADLLQWADRKG